MSLWARLFQRKAAVKPSPAPAPPPPSVSEQVVELPTEPFVFECQMCGKVFEARRKKPLCPECDSADVQLVSG
ncbi:MAG: hydrogenase maturation nickel metallochaperone HypA [Deltaproteobacteria bacterium]|nr:hydrogenase maturation nickel metallochaperone HypA [Deltaproteobacteria bacterium]MBI3391189.1 hydrogenase maturation nickel metallochaperone HypA [Deltaproteobacteria bacterium]